ncbi:hypothetical protein A2U01_0074946, partial [Trifolium medium]|nr:hypothetical protein [Trifolium medium]
NPTEHCYKVEVRDKDLETAQLDSEWTEERFEEESSEESTAETEEGEIASWTHEEDKFRNGWKG